MTLVSANGGRRGQGGVSRQTGPHRAFGRAVQLLGAGEEPLVRIIALVAVLIEGEVPLIERARVGEATDAADLPIVAPIQVEEAALLARLVDDVGVREDLLVKRGDAGRHLGLDRFGDAWSWHASRVLSTALSGPLARGALPGYRVGARRRWGKGKGKGAP